MAFQPKRQNKHQQRLTSFFGGNQQEPSRKRHRAPSSLNECKNGSRFGMCPLCAASIPWYALERHASSCAGPSVSTETPAKCQRQSAASPVTPTTEIHQTKEIPTSPIIGNTGSNTPTSPQLPISTKPTVLKASNLHNNREFQTSLFSVAQPFPGLYLVEGFLSKEEETKILHFLDSDDDAVPFKTARFNGQHMGKRWGVHCNLRDRRVDAPEHPLPTLLQSIVLPKMKALSRQIAAVANFVPNEANAIDYRRKKGHWLKGHVDDRKLSKEPIANLSLAGECLMTFRNQAPNRNLGQSEYKVRLPACCLQVLTGPARYDYSHGIANKDLLSDRRVSITFRESPLTKPSRLHSDASQGMTIDKLFKASKS